MVTIPKMGTVTNNDQCSEQAFCTQLRAGTWPGIPDL